ncbi:MULTISPECIES: homing endonuclease associated repeat-containing protein [Salinibaculum]|uniref:homing endonuclease associated repeat-containing protein n=1 Tax=Salinibaculum TaxID=2732368 RepID=UPI0030CCF568
MSSQREQMLHDLQSLTDDLGRGPLPNEIEKHSTYAIFDYRDEFGSWANALDAANIDKPTGIRIPDNALLAEIRRLAEDLDKTPSERNMNNHGHHGIETYKNRFESWNQAIEAAGLEPNPNRNERSREALLADLSDAADDLGRSPTRREMSDYTEYDVVTYRNRFGSWNEALEAAGLKPRTAQEKVSDNELLRELQRLEEELGKPPTTTEMKKMGEFSPGTYYKRFDTWTDALDTAGCDQS